MNYKNLSGRSGVSAYYTDDKSITVDFHGKSYTYTNESAGKGTIEKMKTLADNGVLLNTFINQNKPGFQK